MAVDNVTDCRCEACRALLKECGPDHFEMYRKKLLIRGWAGSVSPVEKAYQKAHVGWARVDGPGFPANPRQVEETGLESMVLA